MLRSLPAARTAGDISPGHGWLVFLAGMLVRRRNGVSGLRVGGGRRVCCRAGGAFGIDEGVQPLDLALQLFQAVPLQLDGVAVPPGVRAVELFAPCADGE